MKLSRALATADIVTLKELLKHYEAQSSTIKSLIQSKEIEENNRLVRIENLKKIRIGAEIISNHRARGHSVDKSIALAQIETNFTKDILKAGWSLHRDELERKRIAERNKRIIQDNKNGLTYQQIAQKYGFKNKESVGRIIRSARRSFQF